MPEPPTRERIRAGVREILALLADAAAQRAYERGVPNAHVPAELLCMWFDDAYHPDDAAFRSAFTARELHALAAFHAEYEAGAAGIEPLPDSVVVLQALPAWDRVIGAARSALAAIRPSGS